MIRRKVSAFILACGAGACALGGCGGTDSGEDLFNAPDSGAALMCTGSIYVDFATECVLLPSGAKVGVDQGHGVRMELRQGTWEISCKIQVAGMSSQCPAFTIDLACGAVLDHSC